MNSNFNVENDFKKEIILEYFKQARSEINIRIQTNINLILQKIVTCGAGLGFLLTQKNDPSTINLVSCDVQLLGFAIIPIIAMLYDVLIARNIKGINLLANFVRIKIESLVPDVTLWETHLFQEFYQSKKISIEGNLLTLLTLGIEIIVTFIYARHKQIYLLIVMILFILHYFIFRLIQRLRTYLPDSTSPDPFY